MNERAIAGPSASPGALVIPALVIVVSAIIGLVAAGYEVLALLAPLGLLTAYLLFTRPFLGLLLVVATLPLENALDLGEFTATKLLAAGVAMAWGLGKIARRESFHRVFRSSVFKPGMLFIAMALVSALWAERANAAVFGAMQLILLFAFCLLAIDVTDSTSRLRWLVRTMVLSGVGAGLLTVLLYLSGGQSRAGGGVAGINGTAMLMVTLFPLAYLTLLNEASWTWKMVGAAMVLCAAAAVAVTFSRMSMLLLPLVVLACGWQSFRLRRGRGWLAVLLIGTAILAATVVPQEKLVERVESIGPYIESTIGGSEGGSKNLSGRGFHHLVGLTMFADHPLVGVGYGNYGYFFLWQYQLDVSGGHKLWEKQRSPHSSHVGMLAELGMIGTAIWLALLLIPLVLLLRERARGGGRKGWYAASARSFILIAYVIQIAAYAWYTPTQREKTFWVLLAVIVVLPQLISEERATRSAPSHGSERVTEPSDRSLGWGGGY